MEGPTGSVLCDLSGLPRFRATGPHATRYLHNILSQDIKNLREGAGTLACLLDNQSHVRGFFLVQREAGAYYLTAFGGDADQLRAALLHYKTADRVDLDDPDDTSLWTVQGETARDILNGAGFAELPEDLWSWRTAVFGGEVVSIARTRRSPAGGYDLTVPASAMERLRRALVQAGARAGRHQEARYWRMAAGIPTAEEEGGDAPLLLEWGLPDTYSLTKGCYVGQEIVARQNTSGVMHRRLALFELESGDLPAAGSAIHCKGQAVGAVTSSAANPAGAGGVLLGFVKAGAEGPFTLAGGAALGEHPRSQEVLA